MQHCTEEMRISVLSWHLSLHLRVFKCRAACGGLCFPSVGLFMGRLLTEVITLALHRIVECIYSICEFLPYSLQFEPIGTWLSPSVKRLVLLLMWKHKIWHQQVDAQIRIPHLIILSISFEFVNICSVPSLLHITERITVSNALGNGSVNVRVLTPIWSSC